jgi:hypothetical protein
MTMTQLTTLGLLLISATISGGSSAQKDSPKARNRAKEYAGNWVSAPTVDKALGHTERKRGGFLVPLAIEISIDETLDEKCLAKLRDGDDSQMSGHRMIATGRFRRNEQKEGVPAAITYHDGNTYLWHPFVNAPARNKVWLVHGATKDRDLLFVEWFSDPRAQETVSAFQRAGK